MAYNTTRYLLLSPTVFNDNGIKIVRFVTGFFFFNWPLQPFSQDIDLVSHTIYVVCVNFIHKWWDLQFKVDSERLAVVQ